MPHPVAKTFLDAAQANRDEGHRRGNLVVFEPGEHLIVAGDIHGSRQNLTKIIAHADLASAGNRMLVLQEIIHGGPTDADGGCRSFELLMRAARLKGQFPRQVHFLMSNHDVSQITGNEISKEGLGWCKAFNLGLANAFGDDAVEVGQAIAEFVRSEPLAARCPNGVFLAHSLPSPGRLDKFDPHILDRDVQQQDLTRGHSVYELIWGRRQDDALLKEMGRLVDASLFITGHQPQPNGWAANGRQLIIGSDTPHGVIAEFDADEPLAPEDLERLVRPIVTL